MYIQRNDKDILFTSKITPEQSAIVSNFIEVLYDDTKLEEYWNMISDIDKAMAFVLYDSEKKNGSTQTQEEWIIELREWQREYYSKVQVDYGVADFVRYTKYGEAYIYLLPNIKVGIKFIAESEHEVYPIRTTIDAKWENKGVSATLKVRLFDDSFRLFNP